MSLDYYTGLLAVLVSQEEVDRLVIAACKDKALTSNQYEELMEPVRAKRLSLQERNAWA